MVFDPTFRASDPLGDPEATVTPAAPFRLTLMVEPAGKAAAVGVTVMLVVVKGTLSV